MSILDLARGFPGHPSHPPLTDATIGAWTVGTAAAVLSWAGWHEATMASAALVAMTFGMLFALPTIATGFLDYVKVSSGTPLRRTVNMHMVAMLTAFVLYGITVLQIADAPWRFEAGEVGTTGGLLALGSLAALTIGGWIGGTITFVYGMRVESAGMDTPATSAISPAPSEEDSVEGASGGGSGPAPTGNAG